MLLLIFADRENSFHKKYYMKKLLINSLLCFIALSGFAQNAVIEGYVFEDNNRGYLNEVEIIVSDASGFEFCKIYSDRKGFFTCEVPVGQDLKLSATKRVFEDFTSDFTTKDKGEGEKVYLKIKMQREPGYIFDATLAEEKLEGMEEVDAIQGALIEIYNNTSKKEELVLKDHPFPTFQYTLQKGNHYTIMIRKEGFFTKRIEAYVDVDGCILCMDGVNEVAPGVSDNLTAGNNMGTLLANIELTRAELNKSIEIKNIYYDFNSARIKTEAKKELDKVVYLMKTNPSIIVELGSHTDSRGKATYNQKLSQERAESAVEYITTEGEIDPERIKAKGYGEAQLVNKCADGVDCTEEQHQDNRRTELKIVGMSQDKEAQQSLAQIIEAEQFEIMLQEVLNQEVIEIKEGEPVPEELEKGLKEQSQTKETSEETKKETSKVSIQEKEAVIISPVIAEAQNTEKSIEQGVEVVKEQAVKTSTVVETVSEVNETEVIETEAKEMSTGGGAIIGEVSINSEVENDPSTIPVGFNGYKIEIWKSDRMLLPDHQIFTQHGNIVMDEVRNGILSYMIGTYDKYEDAFERLNSDGLLEKYPKAKIIQYEEGQRVDF